MALEIAVVVALTVLNGLFAMSETAMVSARRARLREQAEGGDRGGARRSGSPRIPTGSSLPCRSGSPS